MDSEKLKQFDVVFHIALKFVKNNEALETIIVKQHKGLSRQKVSSDKLAEITRGETQLKVLLMLDGYDEYTPGTNSDIDKAITKDSFSNCCILLTSRDTKELKKCRPYMDVEAEITGFDLTNVEEYITKYMESTTDCKQLMEIVHNSKLVSDQDYGIMEIPIFLHMICVLYQRKVSLPKTKTGVISAIVERCPDWEEMRKSEKETDAEMKVLLDDALILLGKLCWEKLQQGNKDLIFAQVSIMNSVWNAGPRQRMSNNHLGLKFDNKLLSPPWQAEILEKVGAAALQLGLLMGTEDESGEEKQQDLLRFYHLLIMEFCAGKYLSTLSEVLFTASNL